MLNLITTHPLVSLFLLGLFAASKSCCMSLEPASKVSLFGLYSGYIDVLKTISTFYKGYVLEVGMAENKMKIEIYEIMIAIFKTRSKARFEKRRTIPQKVVLLFSNIVFQSSFKKLLQPSNCFLSLGLNFVS